MDKGHGRIETRKLWSLAIDPSTLGLAGAAQLIRLERQVQTVRQGEVIKQTHEVAFPFTSLWSEEAGPIQLQELIRDHWSIENGRHHRRDRAQDEDRCTVGETHTARNLSLFRSVAIFLFQRQAKAKGGKKSLPDFEHHVHRQPWGLIRRFTQRRSEE